MATYYKIATDSQRHKFKIEAKIPAQKFLSVSVLGGSGRNKSKCHFSGGFLLDSRLVILRVKKQGTMVIHLVLKTAQYRVNTTL